MNFFQRFNPFYWKQRALMAEQNYDHACECFNHLQDENVELKQQIEILSVQYEYPDPQTLISTYAMTMVKPDVWRDIDTGAVVKTYSTVEAKLLLDNAMLKQQLEAHELFYTALRSEAGGDIHEKVGHLIKRSDGAVFSERSALIKLKKANDKLEATEQKLAMTEVELERSKAINAKWFQIAIGYGVNDFTLLTKNLWGSNFRVVEFDNDKVDRSNS